MNLRGELVGSAAEDDATGLQGVIGSAASVRGKRAGRAALIVSLKSEEIWVIPRYLSKCGVVKSFR